jgi:hypothetical protein
MKKIITTLSFGLALLTPTYLFAQGRDHDRDHRDDQRYYDKHHKDYHEWNSHEDRAWHMYWERQHRQNYVDWNRANERQREDYWNWRHSHPDSVLQINIGH